MSSFSPSDVAASGRWPRASIECVMVSTPEARAEFLRHKDAVWRAHVRRNPSAFDGKLLGLDAIRRSTPDHLLLAVRETSFSDYVATRDPSYRESSFGVARASPIGITSVVVSSDGVAVVTKRSEKADQNPGMLYFVGGYAEGVSDEVLPDAIGENAVREIEEELGIGGVTSLTVLGVAVDRTYCHPEVFLVANVVADIHAIAESWRRARGRDEASSLMPEPMTNLLRDQPIVVAAPRTWSYEAAVYFLRRNWSIDDGCS